MLSEGWVQTCERLLEQMKQLSEKEGKDRLDLVQSMRFTLYALHRSLLGWMNWVNNPDIMAAFKKEELDEMTRKITEFTEAFLEYDVEVTQKGAEKSIGAEEPARGVQEGRRNLEEIFYV